jgi:hypothetical protein
MAPDPPHLKASITGNQPQPRQKIYYDVAISYANEDMGIADAVANRLRQDGYRCFYNPNRLHKHLGLNLSDALADIYGNAAIQVVALISSSYLSKKYPMQEFKAATRTGPGRIIPVRIGNARMPSVLDGISYASHDTYGTDAVAIHVSQALADRIGLPEELPIPREPQGFTVENITPLDNPRHPYSLRDVEFFDTGEKHFVDVFSEKYEFADPRHYITRGKSELPPGDPFSNVTHRHIQAAKSATRTHIANRDASGWPVFNGRKFGVARIRRTRQPESEHHRLVVNIYETDYFTSLFAKQLYSQLNPDDQLRMNRNLDLSQYSGLLASFGFDILLFLPHKGTPHVLLTRRSMNVSEAAAFGGMWHVSMNEGLSTSDRYGDEFDSSSTFYRGFDEELNLGQSNIRHAELYEPFLQYANFEIGIAGAAYTSLELEELLRQAELAADRILETDHLSAIPAIAEEISRFMERERLGMTGALAFCLQSVLIRGITARG